MLNKVLPAYLRDPEAAKLAQTLCDRADELAEGLTDDPATAARVLGEVAESFLNFGVVARREAEQQAELRGARRAGDRAVLRSRHLRHGRPAPARRKSGLVRLSVSARWRRVPSRPWPRLIDPEVLEYAETHPRPTGASRRWWTLTRDEFAAWGMMVGRQEGRFFETAWSLPLRPPRCSRSGPSPGTRPSRWQPDPTGRFVYVTDQYQNLILAYNILTDGTLQSQVNGPFPTDLFPYGMVVDPRGKFLYVTNYNSNDVRAYNIQASTGNPLATAGAGYGTGTGPTCIALEPAYGRYLYTANNLDNSVTGFKLNPSTGVLVTVLNSPFPAGGLPDCVAVSANGTHPVQSITP